MYHGDSLSFDAFDFDLVVDFEARAGLASVANFEDIEADFEAFEGLDLSDTYPNPMVASVAKPVAPVASVAKPVKLDANGNPVRRGRKPGSKDSYQRTRVAGGMTRV